MLLDLGVREHQRDLDARAGRRIRTTSKRLSGDRADHGRQLPRLQRHLLENYTSVRSYRGSLSYVPGLARDEVRVQPRRRAGRHRRLDQPRHGDHRPQRPAVPGDRPHDAVYAHERLVADLGLYAQDTWTIKRLTVNAGLRFDYLNNKVEAQEAPGGRWIGPRHFDEIDRRAELEGPRAAARRRLRSLWQRQDGVEGHAQPVRGDVDRRLRAAINPLNTTVNNATRTWNVRRQRRRHPAGHRVRAARQHVRPADRLRPRTIRTRHAAGSSGATTGSSRRASRTS